MIRYHANTDNPRPESYAEDVKTAQADQARSSEIVYRELASGAETGKLCHMARILPRRLLLCVCALNRPPLTESIVSCCAKAGILAQDG